ncbi:zinc finger, CCHC-type containing protein [Tanacetum coccineum]
MARNTVKEITTNFRKLDKFERHDFRRWQKKMHFLLTTLKVVYVLTTPMPELMEDDTLEAIRRRAKWENDDYICRGHILNEDASSKKFLESDKGKGKEVVRPSVNMTEEGGKNKNDKQNNRKKLGFNENNGSSGSNKKPKLECWKCGKTGRFKRDCRSGNKKNNANASGSGKGSKDQSQDQGHSLVNVWNKFVKYSISLIFEAFYVQVDAIAWWIDSGTTNHVCKDRCWFKTYEPVEDGSVLYMGDDHFAPVHGKGSVVLEFSSGKSITLFNVLYVPNLRVFIGFGYYNNGMFMLNLNKVPDDSGSVYMSSSTVVNSSLWHARLGHVYYKRMLEMYKDDLILAIDENPEKCNKKYVITFIDDASRFFYVYLLHEKDEALNKFRIYKTEVKLQQNDLIKTLRMDRDGEYYGPVFFQSLGIIYETTAPYTPQQNRVDERKNRALEEMVNSMAVVRLPDPKGKTLGEKGIDCIFVGYDEHSKAYRFYVIEPNNFVSINSIIESRDAIFNENCFSLIPRPKDIIPNSDESLRDDHSNDVSNETPKPRRGKRARKAKSYGYDFQLYLVEGSRDQIGSQYSYCYSIEEDHVGFLQLLTIKDHEYAAEKINTSSDFKKARELFEGICSKDLIPDGVIYAAMIDGYSNVVLYALTYGRILPPLLGLDPSKFVIKAGHVSGMHYALNNFFLSSLKCTHLSADSIIRTLCGYLAFYGREALTFGGWEEKIVGIHVSHGGKSRSKSRGGRLKCYICQSEDHLKRNCPKNNRKKSTGYAKKDEQPSSSGSTYDDSEVMMVMSTQAQALLDLIMDSGCSYHMTPRLDILFDFLECDGGSVQLGDNRECKIRGIGKVRLQLRDGSSFVLNNVRYIPELKRNLISLGTLEKEGFTVKMQSGKVKVINGSRVVLSGTRRDNCVYSLDGHAMAGELNASVEEKDSLAQVWHKRLGHISEAGLQVLEKQGLFGKKSLGKLDFCENYVLGKSHRVSFGVGRHTTQGVEGMGFIFSGSNTRHLKSSKSGDRISRNQTGVGDGQEVISLLRRRRDGRGKEFTVEVELQRGSETDQPPDLTDYQLVRDRERRTRTKPLRFRDESNSNMAAYALLCKQRKKILK